MTDRRGQSQSHEPRRRGPFVLETLATGRLKGSCREIVKVATIAIHLTPTNCMSMCMQRAAAGGEVDPAAARPGSR